jgi:uncharacterized membrane protein YphA (DoxX/SURF4 family)
VLRNEGDAAVSVSRVKACCGATAELSATRIPPKGSAVLSVSLAVRDAGAFSKSVQVTCDDPERPLVSVPVSGIAVESGPAAAEGSRPPPPRPCEGAAGLSVAASLVVGAALSLWRGRRRLSVVYCLGGACRLGVGGAFLYAGAMKLCDVAAFAGLLSRYEMLPDASLPFLAAAIPLAECAAGLLLALSVWTRLSAAAVSAMLVVFIVALSQAAVRGLDVSCGCFGGTSSGSVVSAVVRDVFLLAVSVWLALGGGSGRRRRRAACIP